MRDESIEPALHAGARRPPIRRLDPTLDPGDIDHVRVAPRLIPQVHDIGMPPNPSPARQSQSANTIGFSSRRRANSIQRCLTSLLASTSVCSSPASGGRYFIAGSAK